MKGRALVSVAIALAHVGALTSCGGPQSLGGDGEPCFRDDDCQAGLACIAPVSAPKDRRCRRDPTPLISMVEGPLPVQGGSAGAVGSAGVTAGVTAGGATTASSGAGGS